MRTEARYGFTTEPYSSPGRAKEFGFMSPDIHGIIMQEDRMNTMHEMGNTIAKLNSMAVAMQSENRALRTMQGKDLLGVVGPRGWPKYRSFMGNTMTMETACECQSFTKGVGEGVGIGIGVGVTAAVAYAVLSWLKRV